MSETACPRCGAFAGDWRKIGGDTLLITDAQGIAWFEARFGVPIGDRPGAADVARLTGVSPPRASMEG